MVGKTGITTYSEKINYTKNYKDIAERHNSQPPEGTNYTEK